MATDIELVTGAARVEAATAVLQRTRLADPEAGVWDAADVQWWWRRPRPSDDVPLPVWSDADGPCAIALLTAWGDSWQADALVVPGAPVAVSEVWSTLTETMGAIAPPADGWEVLAREDDAELLGLLDASGFLPTDERSGTTWMGADERGPVAPVPTGYTISDRTTRPDRPHAMIARNGPDVAARLQACSLYDPTLDLAVDAPDGSPVGYALFWLDPVTGVGMLEPMRVEDDHQRRGLARALLTEGLDRVVRKGARRLKVGFDGEAGRRLYEGAGFRVTSMTRAYRRA